MEGAGSSEHHASQESGCRVRFTAVMSDPERPEILSGPKNFPRFSGDHSRGREELGRVFLFWFLSSSIWRSRVALG